MNKPYNVLSLGAGVQSSTLIYLSHAGLIPAYDKIYFADTGDEPKAVYEHLSYLQTLADIEIVKIASGKSISEHLFEGDMKFFNMPFYIVDKDGTVSTMRRQCTREFKITPIDFALRSWLVDSGLGYIDKLGRKYVKRGFCINFHLGMSWDEQRRVSEARVQWKNHKYPLIELELSRADCIRFARKHGYKIPPKSSCIFCPYHTNDYWISLEANELERAIVVDDYIRTPEFKAKTKTLRGDVYIHSSCRPLREIAEEGFKVKNDLPVQLSFAAELLEHSCKTDGGFTCFS